MHNEGKGNNWDGDAERGGGKTKCKGRKYSRVSEKNNCTWKKKKNTWRTGWWYVSWMEAGADSGYLRGRGENNIKGAPVNRNSQWREGTSSRFLHWRSRLEGTLIDFLHWKGTTGGTLSCFLFFSNVLLKHGGTGGGITHSVQPPLSPSVKGRIKRRKRRRREINNKWRDGGWERWRSCNYITVYVLH